MAERLVEGKRIALPRRVEAMREIHLIDVARRNVLLRARDHLAILLPAEPMSKIGCRHETTGDRFAELGTKIAELMPALVRVAEEQRLVKNPEAECAVVFHKAAGESVRESIIGGRGSGPGAEGGGELRPPGAEVPADDLRGSRRHDREIRAGAALPRRIEEDESRQMTAAGRHFDRSKIECDRTRRAGEQWHWLRFREKGVLFKPKLWDNVTAPLSMKRLILLFALALAHPLPAQQPTPETVGRLRVAPAPAGAAAPAPAPEPEVTLIPEQVPKNEKPAPEPKAEPKSKTEQSAEELLERIHFREAQIKALRDPQVQAEWDQATKSKTDYDKREALKRYYKLLYGRIVKLDVSVKKLSDLRQQAALRRLEQNRIDPTEPLDPQERVERFDRSE